MVVGDGGDDHDVSTAVVAFAVLASSAAGFWCRRRCFSVLSLEAFPALRLLKRPCEPPRRVGAILTPLERKRRGSVRKYFVSILLVK